MMLRRMLPRTTSMYMPHACDTTLTELRMQNRFARSTPYLRGVQAIRGCPTSWSYWSDLGWCYHTEGKQAAALKAYTRAEELLTNQSPYAEAGGRSEGDTGGASRQRQMLGVELTARVRVKTQVGFIYRQALLFGGGFVASSACLVLQMGFLVFRCAFAFSRCIRLIVLSAAAAAAKASIRVNACFAVVLEIVLCVG